MITVSVVDQVLSALDALLDDHPDLEPAVDFYEQVLPMMIEARPSLKGLLMNPESAQTKLTQGIPLLWGEWGTAEAPGTEPNLDLFMTLCRLAVEGGNQGGDILMRALLEGNLNLKEMLNRSLILDRAALIELARAQAVDVTLVESISRFMLTPITHSYALAFSRALDFSRWQQGYCPVCGAWPTLGELRGRDRLRYLRCGRCGAGWKFNRLQCLWCNNRVQKELSFLFDNDHPTWRIDVCHYCQGYLKIIITFDPLDSEMLQVYDLKTMVLDQMAANGGYKRPFIQPLK